MDRSEEKGGRPSVPRLELGLVAGEWTHVGGEAEAMMQLTTDRSEVEDIRLPTSFRTSRLRTDRVDKIPSQLERLTGLIENMMDTLKDSSDCETSPSKDTTLKISPTARNVFSEQMTMQLEDASALALRAADEKEAIATRLRDTTERLAVALGVSEVEDEIAGGLAAGVGRKLEELFLHASHLGLPLDSALSAELSAAQAALRDKQATETVIVTELRLLKRHVENLTGQQLNSLSGNWDMEVPAFCRNVLQVVSALVSSKSPPPDPRRDAVRVNCTAHDLHSVVARLCEILEDCEDTGNSQEFGLQLGMLAVTFLIDSDTPSEVSSLPSQSLSSLSDCIACRRDGSVTDRPPAETCPREEIDQLAYIHLLEDQVVDLRRQLTLSDPEIKVDVGCLSAELETKLEEVVYKLSLANKQIERLKQGKYSPDEDRLAQNYKLKLAEAVIREERLKQELAQLTIEREKLRLDSLHFEAEKEAFFHEHEAALSELECAFSGLQKTTSSAEVQTESDFRMQELEATCKLLQEENHKSQLLLVSQQVIRKESGQWTHLGLSKKIANQIQALYDELEKGVDPGRLPSICKRLQKVKNRLEAVSSRHEFDRSEEIRTDTATGESLFSLSREDDSDDSWGGSGRSPGFSVSRIDQQREELTADLKMKEDQVEGLREELRHVEGKLCQVVSECERLKEERMTAAKRQDEVEALRKKIEEFMQIRTTEIQQLTAQKSDLAQQYASFESEKASFREKRTQLRDKIALINDRQKKILAKEKLLAEKETILLLQEKKADLHKQGVDQLWKENDEKRHELAKCQRVIDDEWKVLMEETRQFEALKVADKRVRSQLEAEQSEFESKRAALQRESEQLQSFAGKLSKDKEAIDREKAKMKAERAVLEEERSQILRSKQVLLERVRRGQAEAKPNYVHQRKESEDSRRELASVIPALQRMLEEAEDEP